VTQNVILATRLYQTPDCDLRSYAGVAFRRGDAIVTGLLDHQDERVSLEVGGCNEDEETVRLFHVFAGLYLDRVAKAELPACEVFRFHRDIFRYGYEHEPIGEVLATEDRLKGRVCLSIERFQNTGLVDMARIVECILADRMEDLTLSVPYQLAPEQSQYMAGAQSLPHPGLQMSKDDDMSYYMKLEKQDRPPKPAYLM
jgi:hypothetical protein